MFDIIFSIKFRKNIRNSTCRFHLFVYFIIICLRMSLMAKVHDNEDHNDIVWGDLQMAVSCGNLDDTKKLIESGVNIDVNKISTNKIMPQLSLLHLAVYSKNTAILNYLLELNKLNIHATDQWGFTPLHYATSSKQANMISILLQNGADVNARSKSGTTVIAIAKKLNQPDLMDLFASKSIDSKN